MKKLPPPVNPEPIRICVIDDETEVLQSVTKLFASKGYRTLALASPIGSSSSLRSFQPDILLLDVNMPTLDGGKLLELFRQTLPELPTVILFSGLEAGELERIARAAGADDFFSKSDGYLRLLGRINYHALRITRRRQTKQEEKQS